MARPELALSAVWTSSIAPPALGDGGLYVRFAYRNPELERSLASARTMEALEAVLQRMSQLIPSFFQPPVYGHQSFARELDALIPDLARRLQLADVAGPAKSNENVCILATRFYGTGGHTKVAEDIARQLGADRVTVIFTDIYRQVRYSPALAAERACFGVPHRAIMVLQAPTMGEKIIELYNLLAALRPTRIFLLGNHMDMVAAAGAWSFRHVVDFVHHADYLPCLGATLPYSAHVDLTYGGHLACREAGHPVVYAAMTAQAPPSPPRKANLAHGLRMATCGDQHKYRHAARWPWADFVAAALKHREGEFFHIGPCDESFRDEMGKSLEAAGVDPGRYQFTGRARSLPDELIDRGINLYVSSYPLNGAKANLEAMACGLAPVVPLDPTLGPLMQYRFPLETWARVEAPSDMGAAIERSLQIGELLVEGPLRAALEDHQGRFRRYVAGEGLAAMQLDETLP